MNAIDYSPPPSQLLCPLIRIQHMNRFRKTELDGTYYRIIDNSYYIYDAREEDKKSSHFHHLNLLLWCNNKEDKENDFYCMACGQNTIGTIYYNCNGCKSNYHKECVESPAVFISPYHPKYPLQLLRFSFFPFDGKENQYCRSCGKKIEALVYYSSIYDLILDPVCARKREFPAINNPRRHEHTLHYFPRKASLACDVCGMDDDKICFYICHQCDFVVHRTCIDLPRVIQTSRHIHRLFFTSSLSSGIWSCGVCQQKIDGNYGEYSCSKGCAYAVHCKCATRRDVWDGNELENQPEKVYDNIMPWKERGDGIIQHFSHPHHNMRFDEHIDKAYYETKQCEACMLPLYDGSICRCMQCDFVLPSCANLPRIKQNMVHAHPFILQSGDIRSYFSCTYCGRLLSGFRYNCFEGCTISLDVRCASLSEPVHHQFHPHPLFLLYTRIVFNKRCSICGALYSILLNCVECVFALCFRCATLPHKVKHEVDEHLLTLAYVRNAIYPYWCEVCEEKMDPKKGYYECSECGTTFHIQCILGEDPNMKPGQIIDYVGTKLDIIPNNHLIRPICNRCQRRCQYKLVFKILGKTFCSYSEIPNITKRC